MSDPLFMLELLGLANGDPLPEHVNPEIEFLRAEVLRYVRLYEEELVRNKLLQDKLFQRFA